jgi:plasmid stabilization system protein ParE
LGRSKKANQVKNQKLKRKLVIKDEAIEDIVDAALWYEQKQTFLGDEFVEEVETVFKNIESNPHIFQIQKKNIRYGYIKRFPYLIIYEVEESGIIIYGVIRAQRAPKKRYSRIKK